MEKEYLIFNTRINALTMDETVSLILERIKEGRFTQQISLNAAKVVAIQDDIYLRESVLDADIINADGMSVVWASKFLGKPLPERVPGIDLMLRLLSIAKENQLKCYFLGAESNILAKLVSIVGQRYGKEVIGGYHHGYFDEERDLEITDEIVNSGADLLFVGISSPRKEYLVNKIKNKIQLPFVMGVGGSFDVLAGKTRRAPIWMQKSGLEWFYRFIQEPNRMWKRYLIGNSKFIILVLKEKLHSIFK
ncbi:WecB/TagA/CpsF family glycosyltransferase [Geofilum rubicundum]|uniref:N-acetylmannosaminyltransferase n=1 Tax=Geofilum rubicundum JCM 15548 TaxID=1236989 RepID=A0A0E9LZ75_9BACT|nr:WecB/TagA/CpsF family glycosyltransferase [Geofilum rubicundum]GAO30608.1 N-acetylmannosaminyltransferase [Geofilum rubicundum JCM 15548]